MRGFVIGAIAVAIACGAVGAGATTARSLATDERELWVAAQDTSAVKIMFSRGGIDTIALPSAEKPHTIEFSPSGRYAYVGDVGSGDVVVVRAADRQVVATLTFGSTKSHQVKPSPDGSTVLVAEQTPLKALVKIAADEAQERWTVTAPPLLLPGTPDCTEYTNDGRRAYVSLKPSGIAVVDVATMALLRVLPTAGKATVAGADVVESGRAARAATCTAWTRRRTRCESCRTTSGPRTSTGSPSRPMGEPCSHRRAGATRPR